MAELFNIPVTTTMGRGAFEENHPLRAGNVGDARQLMLAVSECDLLICVGARFDVSQKLDEFASRAKVIHIDIDPAEVGKTVHQVANRGDVRKVLIDLLRRCQEVGECVAPDQTQEWLNRINRWENLPSCAAPC